MTFRYVNKIRLGDDFQIRKQKLGKLRKLDDFQIRKHHSTWRGILIRKQNSTWI